MVAFHDGWRKYLILNEMSIRAADALVHRTVQTAHKRARGACVPRALFVYTFLMGSDPLTKSLR